MKRSVLLLAAALTSGCGTFNQPPLPKSAANETPVAPATEDPWSAHLRQADVIYFSLTKRSAADSEPAWRAAETLQAEGEKVALGWTELSSTQQPLLDQWQRREITSAELLDRLTAPAQRDWAQRALRPGFLQVALGAPRETLRKLRMGEALSADERFSLPQDFHPRPGSLDDFAERISTAPRLRRYDLTCLYRAHLAAEESIAHNIVLFLRDHPGSRLIVFLPDDLMIDPREVAGFVAQKAPLRQLILDRAAQPNESRPQLLARERYMSRPGKVLRVASN